MRTYGGVILRGPSKGKNIGVVTETNNLEGMVRRTVTQEPYLTDSELEWVRRCRCNTSAKRDVYSRNSVCGVSSHYKFAHRRNAKGVERSNLTSIKVESVNDEGVREVHSTTSTSKGEA